MITDYMAVAGLEIYNSARLDAYLASVGSPLDSGSAVCRCPTFTAAMVGDAPYTTPEADNAPWYDPDVPESADFAGFMMLSVDGLDDHPVSRQVSTGVGGTGAIGPARVRPGTITVTGAILGATCCAVEYGLRWLGEALTGCSGGGCGGDCVTVYNCCPGETMDPAEFNLRHRRTLRRVALVDGPRVLTRAGDGCTAGECSTGADVVTVEFVLSAGVPWLWTDPVPVLDVSVPSDDSTACIDWCVHDDSGSCEGGCRLASCEQDAMGCADPGCRTPTLPAPPSPETCFCVPLAVESEVYDLDLSTWPRWFGAVPIITVSAGGEDLRRVSVRFYERGPGQDDMTCQEIAEAARCTPHSVYEIDYLPAGAVATLDGQVGRAWVECGSGCDPAQTVYGPDGGPLRFPLLDCAAYCVEVSSDAIYGAPPDALVSIELSGRGY